MAMTEADSPQWQQFDQREREAGEFVRALVAGGLVGVEEEQ